MNRNKNKSGFTLIELLVVMSIIALLATISLVAIQGVRESTRNSRRKSDLETIRKALEFYRADCNYYPATDEVNFGSALVGDGLSSACLATNIYSPELPQDTLTPQREYYYNRTSNFDYVLCAALEDEGSAVAACGSCGSETCTYSVGPQ